MEIHGTRARSGVTLLQSSSERQPVPDLGMAARLVDALRQPGHPPADRRPVQRDDSIAIAPLRLVGRDAVLVLAPRVPRHRPRRLRLPRPDRPARTRGAMRSGPSRDCLQSPEADAPPQPPAAVVAGRAAGRTARRPTAGRRPRRTTASVRSFTWPATPSTRISPRSAPRIAPTSVGGCARIEQQFEVRFDAITGSDERRDDARRAGGVPASSATRSTADRRRSSRQRCARSTTTSRRRALERGWLRMYVLRLDDRLAAVMYGFNYGGRFYFYQHGFDDQFSSHSIGLVLMALTIRAAIDEGAPSSTCCGAPSRTSRSGRARRDCCSASICFRSVSASVLHRHAVEARRGVAQTRPPRSVPRVPRSRSCHLNDGALAHARQERAGLDDLAHATSSGSPRRWRADRSGRSSSAITASSRTSAPLRGTRCRAC